MSDLESDLTTYLRNYAGVAALVGDCIEPMELTNPLPAIVYQRISTPPGLAAGYLRPRVRLSCWADTYAGAVALAAQVRLALDHYHGALGSLHALSWVDSERDDRDPETGFWRRIIEVLVFHEA